MRQKPSSFGFPLKGRDDSLIAIGQTPETTIEGHNVASQSPTTGRIGGGRRAGMVRACSSRVGEGIGRGAASVVADLQHVAYTALAEPEEGWSVLGPSGKDAYAVRVDALGDVYTLEGGKHVSIRNSAGVEQATIALPVGTSGQVCRALEIDPFLRRVFVGVSDGGSQASARLWAYERDPYHGWQVLWELGPDSIPALGIYVEKLTLTPNGMLLAGANDRETGRSYMIGFDTLGTIPMERWRAQVPYPLTVQAIAPNDGDIAVGSGENADRGLDPRHPETGQVLDPAFASYKVKDLEDWDTRHWALFDAATLDLRDGDDVFEWPDSLGSQRKFSAAAGAPITINSQDTKYTIASANVTANDTLTFTTPDGSISETYKWVVTPSASGEVAIGGSASLSMINLRDVLKDGGDGTNALVATLPSTLVTVGSLGTGGGGAILPLKCNTQRAIVVCTESSATASLSDSRIFPGGTVTGTAPKLRKNVLSGRAGVYFNGISSKMETLPNSTKATSAAEQQHTLLPGYGNNFSLTESGRFCMFAIIKPYTRYTMACPISQRVDKSGGSWIRRVVSNRNASGVYAENYVGVVERDGTTERTHAADVLSGANDSGFVMVSLLSDPTGDYEVYLNGTAAANSTTATTGTAAANDSLGATTLGQSHYVNGEEQLFWEGEIHVMLVVHRPDDTPMTSIERQLYEGALAWYFGESRLLPATHPYYSVPPPPPGGSVNDWYTSRKVISTTPIVTKLDAQSREIAWMAASDNDTPATIGALGSGMAFLSTGDLVSVGPPALMSGDGSDTASVRLIEDGGDDFTLGWSDDLGTLAKESFTYDKLELAVDEWDNVYIPFNAERYDAGYPPQFLMYSATGTQLAAPDALAARAAFSVALQPTDTGLDDDTVQRAESIVLATQRALSTTLTMSAFPEDGDQIAFDGTVDALPVIETYTFVTTATVDYDVEIGADIGATLDALKAAINGTPRSVLVTATTVDASTLVIKQRIAGSDVTAAVTGTALKFDPGLPDTFAADGDNLLQMVLVTSAVTGNTGRERIQIQVVDGDVWKYGDDYAEIADGGSAALDPNARYVHSVEQWGRVYTTDGHSSVVYDSRTDKVTPYVAIHGGAVPSAFQIIEQFRARLVFAGIAGRPYSLRGTRVGDPFDMQRDPGVIDGTQSFDTQVAIAGLTPDAINGFAPLGDDYGVVFGDRSLTLLRGDPAPGANGQFDDIPSGGVGGAFGRAWCRGPGGLLYYWGSDGELKMLSIGSAPEPVVGARFRRTLQSIDLSQFYMRMRYNTRRDGIDIVACPYGGIDLQSRSFRWERATGAIWEDIRTSSDLTFGDLIVIDGDNTADQNILFTCADGYVRTWSDLAADDDAHPFEGMVAIGPIGYRDDNFETVMTQLQVLLDRQSARCFVELWVSETPDTKGVMRQRFTVRPGMSHVLPANVCGNFVFIVLRGQEPWAFQMAQAVVTAGGCRRTKVTA